MDKTLEASTPEKLHLWHPAFKHITAKYAGRFEAAWVYGSYALGIQTKDSDIDILFYKATTEKSSKESFSIGSTSVSLNFFGRKHIVNRRDQRQNGLYFITRFLAPSKFIGGNASLASTIEQQSIKHLLCWLQHFLHPQVAIKELSPECLLSLIFLLEIKMHHCYLVYFSDWFQSPRFLEYWNSKIITLQGATNSLKKLPEIGQVGQQGRFVKLIELQELIGQFWKFSYAFRNYDESHISAYHQKQLQRINDTSWEQMNKARDYLRQQSFPYGLIDCIL